MIEVPTIRPEQSSASITIGIISAVLSSVCQSIGLILQRKSHLHYENSKGIYKPPYKRSLWRIGFLLFLISNIFGSSIQITTLPLIILSPLQSIGLVFNSLFSSLILHEVFTMNSMIGTVLIGIGAFLIATFGRLPEPDYDLNQFISFLQRRKFIIWCCFNLIVVLTLLIWIILSINNEYFITLSGDNELDELIDEPNDTEHNDSVVLENDNYVHSTISNEYEHFQQAEFDDDNRVNKFIKDQITKSEQVLSKVNVKLHQSIFQISPKNSSLIQGVCFGWVSGTLSGFSLLLAKSTIEILINCITSKSSFHKILNQPMIWIIIISFLTLCLSQLWFLNKGLKLITTSILYPLVFCIYNIVNIGNELVFFNQWLIVTLWQLWNICCGTLLVFVGVLLLSWRLDDVDETTEDEVTTSTPLLRQNGAFHSNHHHHHHKRNFSLNTNSTNKRVGLSSILHIKTRTQHGDPIPESLLISPNFKNYFTFNNNNVNKTPTRTKSRPLSINTSFNEENLDEGHSEYISFGSPNNKQSPSTLESIPQELLLSPMSNKKNSQTFNVATPTKLKFDINGFQNTDIEQSSTLSASSTANVNSNHTTPRRMYGSLGNIFGAIPQQLQESPLPDNNKVQSPKARDRKNSRRILSFEQNQLLGQLQ